MTRAQWSILGLLLLLPLSGHTYTFDQSVLAIPNATYGPRREPCESPSGGDVTLNPGDNWERALEQARPGQRFFLNAGTYGSGTGVLVAMPHGTSGARITVKPNNCAAVTINGRLQPGSHTTIAGMTLSHLTNTKNGFGLTGTVWIGPRDTTGIMVRNNRILADDHYAVYVGGDRGNATVHSTLTIDGNDLSFPTKNAIGWNIVYSGGPGGRATVCNTCVLSRNKLSSAGQEADLIQFYLWGGSWTVSRNWLTSGSAAHFGNHIDIKLTKMGTFQNTMDVVENYIDGTHFCDNCGCGMTHNASDFSTAGRGNPIACAVGSASCAGPGDYAYTLNAKGNYFKNCKRVIWDHRISQRSDAEKADVNSRTLNFTYNVVDSDIANARVGCESNNCLIEHNTFIKGKLRTGGWSPKNYVVRNNHFYQTTFENKDKITSFVGNTEHASGRPSFTVPTGPPPDLPSPSPAPAPVPLAPRNLRLLHE